ncbi:MAG: undecaprenyldiphospho-muramoylpentapeptide beta-N-acetylglucosaminyltransferase [Acidobacteria bacterium]|nr:undecaprenyldiphospho-muramoylpentapeptide beta-N-acetylglucosaminyltransferase [Acidobacteriota bacterium]
MTVMFAGGGTGGHLFPGIAVARALVARHPEASVVFAGTGRGVEANALAREGFAFVVVRSAGLVGKSLPGVLRGLAQLPGSFTDAIRLLRHARPDLVIGLGGYSAGPLVLSAALSGRPTMLMEQNAVPGVTNRMLAPVVRAAAVSFASAAARFGAKAFVTGNPVRAAFFEAGAGRAAHAHARPRLLIVGGSQGAHQLNVAMLAAAPAVAAAVPGGMDVTHQTGERDYERVRDGYRRAGMDARVEPFFDAMADEMAAADLIVCRAGATTLAEVAAAGLPAIVVPLPVSAGDHQRRNAVIFSEAGAAETIEEAELDSLLAERMAALATDTARRRSMSEAARRLARPDAADRIVLRAEELMGLATAGG